MCICTLDVNKGCYIWAQTVMLDDKSLVVDYRRIVLPTVADTIRAVKRKSSSEWLLFLLFVGPNLILFGIFTYWPLIYSFYLSTVRWDLISPRKKPVGLANYEYLWNSDTFRTVMWNSVVFTVGAVGGSMLLGLLSALLLNQKLRGRDTARAIVFMPTLLSGAAIGIVWVYIFDPRYGLMRTILSPTRHLLAELAARHDLGPAGDHHRLRLEEPGLCHRHLPGRPPGHSQRPL